jgi:hypothetical protein
MSDLREIDFKQMRMPAAPPPRIGCIAAEARTASPHG